jgi:hypothetical protein
VIVAIESHQGALHMQISTIGLDIAKNVFQVHGSTRPKRSSSGNGSDGARCWSSSKRCRRA